MMAATANGASLADAAMAQLPELANWRPSTTEVESAVDERTAAMIAAMFDRGPLQNGDTLPPCWHWAYFITPTLQRDISADGHPQKGGFLPPIELPRRMFAGARIGFHQPVRVGERYRKISRVTSIESKEGRSGKLAFVKVKSSILNASGETAIEEEQDIVYRGLRTASGQAAASSATAWDWQRNFTADTILLFRYSSVTFNAHRIHYDFPYATIEEGYRDLVVHGTLLATLMVEELKRERAGAEIQHFRFTGKKPVFAVETFQIAGKITANGAAAELAILSGGDVAMSGQVTFRQHG
jgi:3-methylfumaryl-CoA hydratase